MGVPFLGDKPKTWLVGKACGNGKTSVDKDMMMMLMKMICLVVLYSSISVH